MDTTSPNDDRQWYAYVVCLRRPYGVRNGRAAGARSRSLSHTTTIEICSLASICRPRVLPGTHSRGQFGKGFATMTKITKVSKEGLNTVTLVSAGGAMRTSDTPSLVPVA